MSAAIPAPIVERIPRQIDGCTWYAYAEHKTIGRIGTTARTRARVLLSFAEQWERFAPAEVTR